MGTEIVLPVCHKNIAQNRWQGRFAGALEKKRLGAQMSGSGDIHRQIAPGQQTASFAEDIIDRHTRFGDYDVFYRNLVFLDKRERQVVTQTVLRQVQQHFHTEQKAYYNRYFHTENRVFVNRYFQTENRVFVNRYFQTENRVFVNRYFQTENRVFVNRYFQTENRVFVNRYFQTESRVFANRFFHTGNRELANQHFYTENRAIDSRSFDMQENRLADNRSVQVQYSQGTRDRSVQTQYLHDMSERYVHTDENRVIDDRSALALYPNDADDRPIHIEQNRVTANRFMQARYPHVTNDRFFRAGNRVFNSPYFQPGSLARFIVLRQYLQTINRNVFKRNFVLRNLLGNHEAKRRTSSQSSDSRNVNEVYQGSTSLYSLNNIYRGELRFVDRNSIDQARRRLADRKRPEPDRRRGDKKGRLPHVQNDSQTVITTKDSGFEEISYPKSEIVLRNAGQSKNDANHSENDAYRQVFQLEGDDVIEDKSVNRNEVQPGVYHNEIIQSEVYHSDMQPGVYHQDIRTEEGKSDYSGEDAPLQNNTIYRQMLQLEDISNDYRNMMNNIHNGEARTLYPLEVHQNSDIAVWEEGKPLIYRMDEKTVRQQSNETGDHAVNQYSNYESNKTAHQYLNVKGSQTVHRQSNSENNSFILSKEGDNFVSELTTQLEDIFQPFTLMQTVSRMFSAQDVYENMDYTAPKMVNRIGTIHQYANENIYRGGSQDTEENLYGAGDQWRTENFYGAGDQWRTENLYGAGNQWRTENFYEAGNQTNAENYYTIENVYGTGNNYITRMVLRLGNQIQSQMPKAYILGAVRELGEYSHLEHQNIVNMLLERKAEKVFLVGPEYRETTAPYPVYENIETLYDYLNREPLAGYRILLKGSRSNQMEKILPLL